MRLLFPPSISDFHACPLKLPASPLPSFHFRLSYLSSIDSCVFSALLPFQTVIPVLCSCLRILFPPSISDFHTCPLKLPASPLPSFHFRLSYQFSIAAYVSSSLLPFQTFIPVLCSFLSLLNPPSILDFHTSTCPLQLPASPLPSLHFRLSYLSSVAACVSSALLPFQTFIPVL